MSSVIAMMVPCLKGFHCDINLYPQGTNFTSAYRHQKAVADAYKAGASRSVSARAITRNVSRAASGHDQRTEIANSYAGQLKGGRGLEFGLARLTSRLWVAILQVMVEC